MRKLSAHAEWLRLVEVSGPFISMAMLDRAFPQGLEAIDTPRRQRLRSAYDEWREAVDQSDFQLTELHREWVRLVIEDILEYDQEVLVGREAFGPKYICNAPDGTVAFGPDLIVKAAGDDEPRFFISIHPPDTDLEKPESNDGWPAPLVERMTSLCRTTGIRLGLITNGERWMVVNAPVDTTSSHFSWYSRLWFQEPVTLKAFLSLLGVRRCFGPADETLDALLEESLRHHEEVTDTLGEQVRRAVEVLIQCLDKADQDRNRELLHKISPSELYEAGLTIMMRLVFVLCAEERGLLLLDDPVYDQHYAITTLRSQLAEDADRHGPEVLDRRHDAWTRLLAVFRAIYGGIEHESLRMPALGGSLFDPDRFPFLEGRANGTKWRENLATPLPIDNRTVLLLLEALQLLEQPGGALLLSYKTLDVENIGHVYEGLLEHTVARVPDVTLGLAGSQNAKNPNILLCELETAHANSKRDVLDLFLEKTKRSEPAIIKALNKPVDESLYGRVVTVCGGDANLARRILPFANLLRTDAWGDPIVYRANSFMVTLGADRRETGTHYTPRSLTEAVVAATLEPIAFAGPTEGKPREEWQLKASKELLNLRICDPAMGSGAFLVQACRWLAAKVVEAWSTAEKIGKYVAVNGDITDCLDAKEPMPTSLEDRTLIARRLVAERCIYGVDLNPLAVELTKLSIWLTTMAKNRPFGFLDHNLRFGDSLLGIVQLDQFSLLSVATKKGETQFRIFGKGIEEAVKTAIEIRQQVRSTEMRDIRDIENMRLLDQKARKNLEKVQIIANALVGENFRCGGNAKALETSLHFLAISAGEFLDGNEKVGEQISRQAKQSLSIDSMTGKPPRKPFHWALEFPEVFHSGKNHQNTPGFDAVVFNPPFRSGSRISADTSPEYLAAIKKGFPASEGNTDLCCYFVNRATELINRNHGCLGLIATNSISQGSNRSSLLSPLLSDGWSIPVAYTDILWPGTAKLFISWFMLTPYQWPVGFANLNGTMVDSIDSALTGSKQAPDAFELAANAGIAFKGVEFLGDGFKLRDPLGRGLYERYRRTGIVKPWLNGADLTDGPELPLHFAIDFADMKMEDAQDYPDCFEIVERLVKPVRAKDNRPARRDRWWQYGEKAMGMRRKLATLKEALVRPFTSDTYFFELVSTEFLFTNALIVICRDDMGTFAVLNSKVHEMWARRVGSSLKLDFRYIPSKCFQTFPFPPCLKSVEALGLCYFKHRREMMRNRGEGLTAIYNRFNNPEESACDVKELRDLQRQLDAGVAEAYGWTDLAVEDGLALGHDFYETKQGVRWTVSQEAHGDILHRLLTLNHERHEEEIGPITGLADVRFGDGIKTKKPTVKTGDRVQKIKKEADPPVTHEQETFRF